MALKIKSARIEFDGKTKTFQIGRNGVKDMGFIGNGAFVIQNESNTVESYWFCPIHLMQEEVPDIVAPELVVNDG